jgi:hypothetical protein
MHEINKIACLELSSMKEALKQQSLAISNLSQPRQLQYIMPIEKLPVPLPKHIHRDAHQTDSHLDTPKDDKHSLKPPLQDPLIGIISQHKRKQILEYD